MKSNVFKRFISFVMVFAIMMMFSIPTFAATTTEKETEISNIARSSAAIPAGQTVTLTVGSAPGTKAIELVIVTASEATSGSIKWQLSCEGNPVTTKKHWVLTICILKALFLQRGVILSR